MKPRSKKALAYLSLATSVAFVSAASHLHATALTWDTTIAADATITAGDGTWQNGSGNWNDGATSVGINWNNATPDTATFADTDGTYAITVGGGITCNAITFNNSGYTLSAGAAQVITGTGTITVASGKSATIGTNVTLNRTTAYSFTGGGTLNITGTGATLAAAAGITTVSGSKVVVGAGGTFSGQTSIVIGNNTSAAELEVNGGAVNITTTSASNLVLANNTGAGSAIVTLNSGTITNTLVGGTVRFGSTAANTSSSTFNLNGGILTVGRVFEGITGHSSTFNFNGGTLKVLSTSTNLATYMTGIDTANVRNGGAIFDTNTANATVGQNLVHSTVGLDLPTDGGLTKNGTGTLTLSGTSTYTGTTTINAGSISAANIVVSGGSSNLGDATSAVTLGSAGSQGTLSYSGANASYTRGFTIGGLGGGRLDTSNAATTLAVDTGGVTGTGLFTVGGAGDTTINSAITHTGGVTKGPFVTATSALTLTNGSNTYDGVTTITHGAIVVTANGALGTTSAGTETTAGSLALDNIDYTATETLTGSGPGSGVVTGVLPDLQRGFIQSKSGNSTFRGNILLGANGASRIGSQNGASLTLTGTITQGLGVTTANILFRAGNGLLNVGGDFVTLSNAGNSFGGDSLIFTAALTGYSGVRLGIANALPTNLTISGLGGGTPTAAGTALDLSGFAQTLNGLTGAATLNIINTNIGTPSTLTLNPALDQTTAGTVILGGTGLSGPLGTINLIKDGTFSQTLGGVNTHTGTTTINDGSLIVTGSLDPASAVTVNGGNLGGTGTVGGNVTVAAAGNLAPGASAGTLAITGNLDISAMAAGSGKLKYELDAIAGTNDLLTVGGTLTLGAGVLGIDNLEITNLGGLQVGTYTLITSTTLSGTVSATTALIAPGFNGQLQVSGNNLVLNVTAVAGSAYSTWAATNAPTGNPDDDYDNDGVSNAVEFVLGGLETTNDLGKLPEIATDGTNMTFTFDRDQDSIDPGNTTLMIEVSTDLVTWNTAPSPYAVPDADTGGVINPGVTVDEDNPVAGTDKITLTVPQAPGKKFARLKVVINP